jgi:hypothetical protein
MNERSNFGAKKQKETGWKDFPWLSMKYVLIRALAAHAGRCK